MIEVEQPTEPLAPHNAASVAVIGRRDERRRDESVVEALVVSLGVVMLDKFGDEQTQVPLSGMTRLRHSRRMEPTKHSA